MKFKTIYIIEKITYRSRPFVNITDDMVRVVLTCSIREWKQIEKLIVKDFEDEQ